MTRLNSSLQRGCAIALPDGGMSAHVANLRIRGLLPSIATRTSSTKPISKAKAHPAPVTQQRKAQKEAPLTTSSRPVIRKQNHYSSESTHPNHVSGWAKATATVNSRNEAGAPSAPSPDDNREARISAFVATHILGE